MEYGADEVNAIVLDTGAHATRVGWAGEDAPNYTIPTHHASTNGKNEYGHSAVNLCRANVEIKNPMQNSIPNDFDAVAGLWRAALEPDFDSITRSPILVSDQPWNTQENRKKTLEILLEEFKCPATYLAKTPVLALFAAGRGSGLVVDAGAQTVSVTPVVDGLMLYKPAKRSERGGEYLNRRIKDLVGDVVPTYAVKSKGDGDCVLRALPDLTELYKTYHQNQVYEAYKEHMVQVYDSPFDSNASGLNTRTFEFPDGHSLAHESERYALGEELFKSGESPTPTPTPTSPTPTSTLSVEESEAGVSQLVIQALAACDVDIRPMLANNIVVVGGTSLVQGFTERLNADMLKEYPGLKVRLYASGNTIERKNSAWLGGSVLASLGTFHQLWVSEKEYQEVGVEQLLQRRFK